MCRAKSFKKKDRDFNADNLCDLQNGKIDKNNV